MKDQRTHRKILLKYNKEDKRDAGSTEERERPSLNVIKI
jgi:hypothetical protein